MDLDDSRVTPTSLHVHVAVDGDPASITPGGDDDPFFRQLRLRVRDFAQLSRGTVEDVPEDARVLVGSRIDATLLARRPELVSIVVPWSGIPPSLRASVHDAGRADLQILNVHHNAPSAAEVGLGLLLAATRGIPQLDRPLRRGDWRSRYQPRPSRCLNGGKATILGRGAIGQRLHEALAALGMTVRMLGRPTSGPRWTPRALAAEVAASDVLLIAIPGGPDTAGIVDAAVLDAMPGGVVVNVGRGSVIEEAALFERLSDGRLFAAGLDVWWNVPKTIDARAETMPSSFPFHELDNVVMTPHVGGGLGEPDIESRRAAAVAAVLETQVSRSR